MVKMDFIKEALRQNSHWDAGIVETARMEGKFVERSAYFELEKSAEKKFITILKGMRRTGKSVLAKKLMEKSIQNGTGARQIGWFEFDRAMNAKPEDLDAVILFFESRGVKLAVFDEIHFVPMWQDILKRHYDRSGMKFLATGSSALELDRRSSESLAGRFELVELKPFSFEESLALKGIRLPKSESRMAREEGSLGAAAAAYMLEGGLPEAISMDAEQRKKYIKESLLDPLFYKDLPFVFAQARPELLHGTLELLCATSGSTYQAGNIAQVLGCSLLAASAQIEVLERSLLVRTMLNKTPSIVKQKRTAKKIVFSDNGMLAALNENASLGALAENAAINALGAKMFWKDAQGREIDLLLPERKIALEVKYQESISSHDERHLRYFVERNAGWKGAVVTKDKEEKGEYPWIPLWKLLLLKEKSPELLSPKPID